ncbi:MAG: hypothetical protein AAF846_20060 [Chloroflexota bacterium]
MIGSYKSVVTRQINLIRETKSPPIWHRSFHDRIIRNDVELNKLREYTLYNPSLWARDRYYNEAD